MDTIDNSSLLIRAQHLVDDIEYCCQSIAQYKKQKSLQSLHLKFENMLLNCLIDFESLLKNEIEERKALLRISNTENALVSD